MLAKIKTTFAKLSNYPRLRILVIILAVIFIFVVVLQLLSSHGNKNSGGLASQVQPVSVNPNAVKTPVTQTANTQYTKLADVTQKQQFQSDVAAGNSIFQNPFGSTSPSDASASTSDDSTADQISAVGDTTSTSTGPNSPSDASNTNGTINNGTTNNSVPNHAHTSNGAVSPQQFAQQKTQQQQEAAAANNPQLQQQISQLQQQLQQQTAQNAQVSQIQNSMSGAVGNLTSSWSIPVASTVEGTPAPAPTEGGGPSTLGPVMIKAGTILFAVMNVGLNSDNPGTPVMATIVTGKYRGAKLLGAFTAQNSGTTFQSSALVVQFNQMSMPSMDHNISINAYALDENTANNAIASSVNNHYLVRYGMLFAASFLQGFGNAYQNYNYTCPPGTTTCLAVNSTGTPNTQATSQTAVYQGIGQIGTNLANSAMNVFNNTPPTIKLDAGTGIGVLFMSDMALPTDFPAN